MAVTGHEPIKVTEEELTQLADQCNQNGEWVVYVLTSVHAPRRTYAGVSNKVNRRLRQHNGELVGGAVATRTCRPWRHASIVHGFGQRPDGQSKSLAMRFEWFCKACHYIKAHGKAPEGSTGPERRMTLMKFAYEKCLSAAETLGLTIQIKYSDPNFTPTQTGPLANGNTNNLCVVLS